MFSAFAHFHGIVTPQTIQSVEFSGSGQPFPSPGDLPNPEIKPRSPTLQVNYLPAEPQGKPKNTGVGSLSLLQQIFPTQESNLGSPALQADSLPTELSGEPINTPTMANSFPPWPISSYQHDIKWFIKSLKIQPSAFTRILERTC